MEFTTLTLRDLDEVKDLFTSVFTQEPWNDDWSDEAQLTAYLTDLMGNPNSLAFGLRSGGELIAASLGSVRHWYQGTEYYMDEFFIRADWQGKGLGRSFLEKAEEALKERGIHVLFLLTEKDVPAYGFYTHLGFRESEGNTAFHMTF